MGGLGCDNMTAVLVCLLNGQSYEELAEKCAKPVQKDILQKCDKGSATTTTMTKEGDKSTKVSSSDNLSNSVEEQTTETSKEGNSGGQEEQGMELT